MSEAKPRRRVLVLGGTGFLGSEVARAYLAAGHPVTVLARRRPTGNRAAWLHPATMVLGPAEDPDTLERALDGVGHVVHALGSAHPASVDNGPLAEHLGVVPTLLGILEALEAHPATDFTFLSSGGAVYGNSAALPASEEAACHPVSIYGATKLAAEHLIEAYAGQHQITARILRVTNAYGPEQAPGTGQGVIAAFLDAAMNDEPVQLFGDGSNVRDYVEVSDVARALVQLTSCDKVPMVVNIGSGFGHSINQVLNIVEATTATRVKVERFPARSTDVEAIYVDTSRLCGLIDWHPTPLEEGVASMWEAWHSGAPSAAGRPA